MNIVLLRPQTLEGVKRLADRIEASAAVPRREALKRAAQQAGYENFSHARAAMLRRVIPTKSAARTTTPSHRIYLTRYWNTPGSQAMGRETLPVDLPLSLEALGGRGELRRTHVLDHFKLQASDHLVHRSLASDRHHAQEQLSVAGRILQFMATTGLKEARRGGRAYPREHRGSTIPVPGQDHAHVWEHGLTGHLLITDEPYDDKTSHFEEKRAAWAATYSYAITKSAWPGMHNPHGGCSLHLIGQDAQWVSQVEQLVQSIPVMPSDWSGESAGAWPAYRSPGECTTSPEARGYMPPNPFAPKPIPRHTKPYTQTFVGPQLRPDGRMPIAAHHEVARLLGSLLSITHERRGIYNRIDLVRSTLDEWVQREYDHNALPNEVFHALYYRAGDQNWLKSITPEQRDDLHTKIAQVRTILTRHYPDCRPLHSVIRKLNLAEKSLNTWP